MTVAELGRRMTHAEYVQWAALDSVEPVGAARLDILMALQTHMLLQPHLKKSRTLNVSDLLPSWWRKPKRDGEGMEPDELLASLRGMAARMSKGS